ncbi:hypothetical protein G7Y89_g12867 [Cudoniella acicularis]|uniref:Uncharacterized protein n=1 Tax=Cudoniella acicularis TaxID=354080 RepID=A0A8H4RAM2_9HELO|nr:hypothetical protein G7Y89_g12867 [Cudoniella acicularis]
MSTCSLQLLESRIYRSNSRNTEFPVYLGSANSTLIDPSNSTIHETPVSETSLIMLILSSDRDEEDWNAVSNSIADFGSRGAGEWAVFEMNQNFTFKMTLCFLIHATTIANIRLDINVNPKDRSRFGTLTP